MKNKIIEQGVKEWNWKSQNVGSGDDMISIPVLLSRIERNYYVTQEEDFYVNSVDLSTYSFQGKDLYDSIIHSELIDRANLDFPIILNRKGQILDGRHRVAKAIKEGIEKIKAIRILDSDVI